ncbi:MAG: ABC transporter ATP-binding protein [Methanomicrobiaceae archaeon]|nr:ABC transporter ATP-binding protein [Methanomicrobiaceae archaeon]
MNQSPILVCKNLTIGYNSQKSAAKEVSKNLNLTLKRGELVCLIGPNGSGKSTLIRTITGIQPAIDGEVWLCNKRIEEHSSDEKAKTLSVVLTNPVSAGYLTAYDIVALGRFPYTNWAGRLSESDNLIVTSALMSVGAGNLTRRFMHEMSDGERQKVMIARALAQEPEMMVLDEPTAFLDLPHKIETMRILRNVAQKTGKSILLSTHDLNLAIRCADQLWIIDRNGKMISGVPEDLILSGIFGSAFEIEGVSFDSIRGEFTIPVQKKGTFTFTGTESVERIWTLCALERIGFTPADGDESDITLTLEKNGDKPAWLLTHAGGENRCESICKLVESISYLYPAGDDLN